MPLPSLPRRGIALGTGLAVLVAGSLALLAGAPTADASPPPPGSAGLDPGAARALAADSSEPPTVTVDRRRGVATAVTTRPGHPLRRPPTVRSAASPETAARAFLARHRQAFGLATAAQLRLVRSVRAPGGSDTVIRLQQTIGAVPVLGGDLTVTLTAAGNVLSVVGTPSTAATVPAGAVTAGAAARAAVAAVAGRNRGAFGEFRVASTARWLYDRDRAGQPGPAGLHPVWRLGVQRLSSASTDAAGRARDAAGGEAPDRYDVLVDARTAAVELVLSAEPQARNRSVCDAANRQLNLTDPAASRCGTAALPVTRSETGAVTGIAAVDNVHRYLGDSYDFFRSRFGRDSVDNAGLPLKATVRICDTSGTCPYDNAFWNGEQIAVGAALAGADDVIAHELTHAVTQYTANLFYAYQSGAINESMSDVFGEFVDLTNGNDGTGTQTRWLMGEDITSGSLAGGLRNLADPTAYAQPDRMTSSLYEPDRGTVANDPGNDNGGVHTNSGVGNKAAALIVDGGTFNGRTITGIGIDRAAQIYYRTLLMLPSGSDYAVLGATLSAACLQLTQSSGGITTDDCTQVDAAVTATEMALQPTVAHADAAEAPICPPGQSPSWRDVETFDSGTPAISRDTFDTAQQIGWLYDTSYATSGRTSLTGLTGANPGVFHLRAAYWNRTVTVPAGGSTYVRFAQAYQFDYQTVGVATSYYDGGQLQISVNGAAYQTVNPALLVNGFTGSLTNSRGLAWTGDSRGFITSRVDLSGYAGKSVRLRFLIHGDEMYSSFWTIDDLTSYTCSPSVATTATLTRAIRPARPSLPLQMIGTVLAGAAPVTVGQVVLQRRPNSSVAWSEVALTTLDGTGGWSFRLLVLTSGEYRVRYAGYGPFGESTSESVAVIAVPISRPSTVPTRVPTGVR
jgi:Zn-dependent metalloprotease